MLLLASLGLASFLPPAFMTVLAVYYVGTLAYSFGLKRIVMVDVLALAGLYTVRVVAGGAATGIELSFWLLMFSVFSFLNLAMVKRYAELYAMRRQGKLKVQGRGYEVEDLHLLQSLGPASGYISVLVLALYVNSPDIAHTLLSPTPDLVGCAADAVLGQPDLDADVSRAHARRPAGVCDEGPHQHAGWRAGGSRDGPGDIGPG